MKLQRFTGTVLAWLGMLLCGIFTDALAQSRPHLSIRMDLSQRTITIDGGVGCLYALQHTTNLTGTTEWNLLDMILMTNASQVFVDSSHPPHPMCFYRVVSSPVKMAYIPPGSFLMGSPETELDRFADEGPQTSVILTNGFYMGIYPVTQLQYQSVMGTNPSFFTGDLGRPVEQVTWTDATNFCASLTAREQSARRMPTNYFFRLPTEAEWEYASRAGTTTRYSFGDDPDYTILPGHGWFIDNSEASTHEVGEKTCNPWGLYDTSGNVYEWCRDWYGAYPGGNLTNPTGPVAGSARVRRGGSWQSYPQYCRSANRSAIDPATWYFNTGFRVVLSAK